MPSINQKLIRSFVSLSLIAMSSLAYSQSGDHKDNTGLIEKSKRGWWFYEDPEKKPKEIKKTAPAKPAPKEEPVAKKDPPKEKKKDCTKPSEWDESCGFIDPGMDFAFQEKQRDVLMEKMALSKNDPKAVENFQRYMKWATGRALEVANIWMYNTVQSPDLDPSARAPVSNFGIRLMTEVKKEEDKEVYRMIAKDNGGALVYFTRSDCAYCHSMSDTVLELSEKMGIPVWNASLDEKCISGFKECRTAKQTEEAARALQVSMVPTLFLYVKPESWIRVANGMSTSDQIEGRVVNFFMAYRNALLNGVNNSSGGKPSVDFSYKRDIGVRKGVDTDPSKEIRKPTEAEVDALIGNPSSK